MRDFRFELYLFDEGDERKQTQTLPQFLNSGIRNFCIQNQDPGMHFTSENRPATGSDPRDYVRHAPN